ncbi:zeta toxin family protein [Actinomadura hibisca]|uniref:zeta toxin family protein n=1 Tax=Actinomadura hibisca TaxID=68565 RepID=UPI0008305FC0|nr:zeta toxin family protein [Actinomadura hibisca]
MDSSSAPSRQVLIVLRGNSGSGKSSIAAEIRRRYEKRDLAVVPQDVVRRQILRDRDVPGAANIDLIDTIVRWSLDHGYHVLLEGILFGDRYAEMIQRLVADHTGPSLLYYMDIPFPETLRRHATKPVAHEFGEREMAEWYRERDLLPGLRETVIGPAQSLETTVEQIMRDAREARGRAGHDGVVM